MSGLPALPPNADIRSITERVNRLTREFNRTERKAPIIGTDTGTSTAYAITPTPGIATYDVGQVFSFQAANANTTTNPTLNVNGKGAGTITYPDGSALTAGDIALNATTTVTVASTTPTFHLLTTPASAFQRSATLTTRGDLLVRGASANQRLALGAAGALLKSNGTDPAWFTIGSALQVLRVNAGATDLEFAAPSGVVSQIQSSFTGAVATGTTQMPNANTIPTNTQGDQYLSVSITPKSATSTLIILSIVLCANSGGAGAMTVGLFQDTTANALKATEQRITTAGDPLTIPLFHLMTSGTTSATTFKIRIGANNPGTTTFNGAGGLQVYGGVAQSGIIVIEVSP